MQVPFTILCLTGAVYFTTTQSVRFQDNKDTSSISYKFFAKTVNDKYPTFSVCFKGAELYWFKNQGNYGYHIFNEFGITAQQYVRVIEGDQGIRYDHDFSTHLYRKTHLDIRNVSTIGFDEHWDLNLEDILRESDFVTQEPNHSFHYENYNRGEQDQQPPFKFSYRTSDVTCFTRQHKNEEVEIRLHDLLAMKRSVLSNKVFGNGEVQIIIHYPGQLLRSLESPNFKIKLNEVSDWSKRFEIYISDVTVLIKRPNSKIPCNPNLQKDDLKLMIETIKVIRCVPIYWKRLVPKDLDFKECKSQSELKDAHRKILNYKEIQATYEPPCVEMAVSSYLFYAKEIEKDNVTEFQIVYKTKSYQEIENIEEFGLESFFSATGGFIGIFMGYSLLQLPERMSTLPQLLRLFKGNCLY